MQYSFTQSLYFREVTTFHLFNVSYKNEKHVMTTKYLRLNMCNLNGSYIVIRLSNAISNSQNIVI